VLDTLLRDAPAALPQVLQISKALIETDTSELYDMASHVAKTIGDGIDGRLRIQYAITTMCAQRVSLNAMATQIISVLILCFD